MKRKYIYIIFISILFLCNVNQVYADEDKCASSYISSMKTKAANIKFKVTYEKYDIDNDGEEEDCYKIAIKTGENEDIIITHNESDYAFTLPRYVEKTDEWQYYDYMTVDDYEDVSNGKFELVYRTKSCSKKLGTRVLRISDLDEDDEGNITNDKGDTITSYSGKFIQYNETSSSSSGSSASSGSGSTSSEKEYKLENSNLTDIVEETLSKTFSGTVTASDGEISASGTVSVTVQFRQLMYIKYDLSTINAFAGGGIGAGLTYLNKFSWETDEIECPTLEIIDPKTVTEDGERITEYGRVKSTTSSDCTSGGLSEDYFEENIFSKIKAAYKGDSLEKTIIKMNNTSLETISNDNAEDRTIYIDPFEFNVEPYKNVFKDESNGDTNMEYESCGNKFKNANVVQTYYKVTMQHAFINRKTGRIKYTGEGGVSDQSNYIDAGYKNFLPVEYKNDKLTIEIKNDNLSVIDGITISSVYNSQINVEHKYFEKDNEGYAFSYRIIDLQNSIPNFDAGDNWIDYLRNLEFYVSEYGNKNSEIIDTPASELENYMKDDKENTIVVMTESETPEYTVSINEELGDDANGYGDYSNLNNDGTSNFVKSNFEINNNKHFKLGCGYNYNGIDRESDCG